MTRYRVKVSGWAIVEALDRETAEAMIQSGLGQLGEARTVETVEFFTEAREATPQGADRQEQTHTTLTEWLNGLDFTTDDYPDNLPSWVLAEIEHNGLMHEDGGRCPNPKECTDPAPWMLAR